MLSVTVTWIFGCLVCASQYYESHVLPLYHGPPTTRAHGERIWNAAIKLSMKVTSSLVKQWLSKAGAPRFILGRNPLAVTRHVPIFLLIVDELWALFAPRLQSYLVETKRHRRYFWVQSAPMIAPVSTNLVINKVGTHIILRYIRRHISPLQS